MARLQAPPLTRRERRAQNRAGIPRDRASLPRRPVGRRPAWQSPIVIVSVAALLIAVVVIVLGGPKTSTSRAELIVPSSSNNANLVDGASLGSKSAPVVIELYADFQCPACKLLVTTELPRLVREFVVPGTVRIEANDIDIRGAGGARDESLTLGVGAACAAEQGRYWQFHDLVFWNQGRENMGDHDAAFIARVADQAGVEPTAWNACIARDDLRQAILRRTATAEASGIMLTPTLLVNGQAVVGVPNYDQLTALITHLAGGAASPGAS